MKGVLYNLIQVVVVIDLPIQYKRILADNLENQSERNLYLAKLYSTN